MSEFEIWLETATVKFTLHGVPDRPGIAAEIFDRLSQAGINVDLVVQTAHGGDRADLSLAVPSDHAELAMDQLEKLRRSIPAERISKDETVALITVEKEDLAKIPGAAARMFRTLANLGINIDLISTSLNSITCLITQLQSEDARRALMDEFNPGK